jgi:C1A family cysteine protease
VLSIQVAVALKVSGGSLFKVKAQFDEYIVKYGKTYTEGSQEYQTRFRNFAESLKRVEALNSKQTTATYGITRFSDMSKEEFARFRLNGGRKDPAAGLAIACLASGVLAPHMDETAAPASFDWRTKGKVTPVKDQGQCGSCWTFSTTGSIESAWAIAGHPLVELSEQEIVDCSQACCMVETYNVCNQGCDGGWPWSAFYDIMSWKGLPTETAYPYTGVDGTCSRKTSGLYGALKNYTCVTKPDGSGADETQMAAFVAANGPVSVALNADLLMDYTSGIITDPDDSCDGTSLDHAVLVVGYGSQAGTDFWIVKNSWNADWGEQGYFRMQKGASVCGINNAVSHPILA